MSAIFDKSVTEVLKQIDHSSHIGAQRTGTDGRGEFARLLGELENGRETESLSVKANSTSTPQPALSNLNMKEWEQGLHLNQPAPERAIANDIGPKIPPRQALKNVKIPSAYVNNLTVESGTPPRPNGSLETPPAAPEILSARRVDNPFQSLASIQGNSASELEQIIFDRSAHHGVDPLLSVAVARAESSLEIDAVSQDGHYSKGLFQLLDSTGEELHARYNIEGDYDPFDPKLNSHLGVGYLKELHEIFSTRTELTSSLTTYPAESSVELEKLAVAAFNTGQGNVARAQARAAEQGANPGVFSAVEPYISPKTRQYVGRVLALREAAANLQESRARV